MASFWQWLIGSPTKNWVAPQPPPPVTLPKPRFAQDPMLDDIDRVEAQIRVDGDYAKLSELAQAIDRDSYARSLLDVRIAGLTSLPALYPSGPKVAVRRFRELNGSGRDGFDQRVPPPEWNRIIRDALVCGTGAGQWYEAGETKLLVHRSNHLLKLLNGQWLYNNRPITPGEGWVIMARGLEYPYLKGLWPSLARSVCKRNLGELHRLHFVSGNASGMDVLTPPDNLTDDEIADAVDKFAERGATNIKVLTKGWVYETKETQYSIGTDAMNLTVADGAKAISLDICGQEVSSGVASGKAFMSLSYFEAMRKDLIIADADMVNTCVNEQIMPVIAPGITRMLDTTDDGDKVKTAQSLTQGASAIKTLLDVYDQDCLDLETLTTTFSIPTLDRPLWKTQSSNPDQPSPTDHQQPEPDPQQDPPPSDQPSDSPAPTDP